MPFYQRFRVAIRLDPPPQRPQALAEALVWHGAVEPAVRAGRVEFLVGAPSTEGAQAVAARRAVSLLASAQNEAGEPRTRIISVWVAEPASRYAGWPEGDL